MHSGREIVRGVLVWIRTQSAMAHPVAARRWWLLLLAALAAWPGGCAPEKAKDSQEPTPSARDAAELKLLVVDDPAMSEAIDSLRAEWTARTGGKFAVSQVALVELLAADAVPEHADAIIYPSAQLGSLAHRDWLAPLPADYAENRELAWADTFELLQLAETTWGQTPYAVPYGSPVLTCYYRTDLLDRAHKSPPNTWQEFHELAELFAKRESLGDAGPPGDAAWHAVCQPLAEGWAAATLLARAAAYAKHRDHYSTLFNIDTMEPLIAGPAFVRALDELVADAKLGPPNQLELDPAGVRSEFLAGRAALAIAWPGHAGSKPEASGDKYAPTGFIELPGAREVYNIALAGWDKRQSDESPRVPLVGLAGRLGSVTRDAAQPDLAFQLLAWLSGREWGPTVSSASPATTLYRRSQLKDPRPWLDPRTEVEAGLQYATTVNDALGHATYLAALRIPGRQEYWAALDSAVRAAVRGEKTTADALTAAAAEWRTITEKLGVDSQRKAYRQSLGLEP
jgi:multiple sugar transport system substrate-binding protein